MTLRKNGRCTKCIQLGIGVSAVYVCSSSACVRCNRRHCRVVKDTGSKLLCTLQVRSHICHVNPCARIENGHFCSTTYTTLIQLCLNPNTTLRQLKIRALDQLRNQVENDHGAVDVVFSGIGIHVHKGDVMSLYFRRHTRAYTTCTRTCSTLNWPSAAFTLSDSDACTGASAEGVTARFLVFFVTV